MFLANYSDGLTDFYLPKMIDEFSRRDNYASFLSVQPRSSSLDTVQMNEDGSVRSIKCMKDSNIWVNGGYFVMRNEVFRYIKPGEELVYEPFQRMIPKAKFGRINTTVSGSAWIPSRTSRFLMNSRLPAKLRGACGRMVIRAAGVVA